MNWKAKTATALSAVAIAVGGGLATAPHAAAAGDCASGYLCVWDGANFTGHRIATASTRSCFDILAFSGEPHNFNYIVSYSSDLPVNAVVWDRTGSGWVSARTLVAGGFSSNIGISGLGIIGAVCEGGQVPWDYFQL